MLTAAILSALILQQAAPAQVVWSDPAPPPPAPSANVSDIAPIPESARADPYGYERAQCSPLIRNATESMEACQARVRSALAAHMGDALPPGLSPASAADTCRQEAAGDRYALQCGTPGRAGQTSPRLVERTCETRPRAQSQGGVAWVEECRPADGSPPAEEGLKIRLGGDDD